MSACVAFVLLMALGGTLSVFGAASSLLCPLTLSGSSEHILTFTRYRPQEALVNSFDRRARAALSQFHSEPQRPFLSSKSPSILHQAPSRFDQPLNTSLSLPIPIVCDAVIRNNTATRLWHTDFLVVKCSAVRPSPSVAPRDWSDAAHEYLMRLSLPYLKSITMQQSYRHLLSTTQSRGDIETVSEMEDAPHVGQEIPPFQNPSPRFSTMSHRCALTGCDGRDTVRPENRKTHISFDSSNLNDTSPKHHFEAIPKNQHGMRSLTSLDESVYGIGPLYHADTLWSQGYTGKHIRVAVFDTGIAATHPHFRNIVERSNWCTDDQTLNDELGHGTHVAGVIAGSSLECRGFAPDAEILTFRVFNSKQLSFTAWFLDAFNHALHMNIDVLNLSIGGPDFLDQPFVDKVRELSASGVIVVSAIGNDGPLYGTLNNPADQMDVIGVGGVNQDGVISPFSSRGMTTQELPYGYGRVKPDIVALANQVIGSKVQGGCRFLTGTSVASPVVAGALALLASTIPTAKRTEHLNPARLKQALAATAERGRSANIFEQGAGKLNLIAAAQFLSATPLHVSTIPATLNLTDCPYMWPYCAQPLFHTQAPVLINITVLNSFAVASLVKLVEFTAHKSSTCPTPLLSVYFAHSDIIWPWSGFLAVSLSTIRDVVQPCVIDGFIVLEVVSDDPPSLPSNAVSVNIPLSVRVIPAPLRQMRVAWDQFHNLRYPSGYFPRDNLDIKTDALDWNGDHPHTNFRTAFNFIIEKGYFLDIIGHDWTCLNTSLYSTLLLVDPEEEFFAEEIAVLINSVNKMNLSLILFADWYNVQVMRDIKFFDENTASWWTPSTGGANLPALNDLLQPFDLTLSSYVVKGRFRLGEDIVQVDSGSTLARAPPQSLLLRVPGLQSAGGGPLPRASSMPILALVPPKDVLSGRIVVYTDSNCLDENNQRSALCLHFLQDLLSFASLGTISVVLQSKLETQTTEFIDATITTLPQRMLGSNLNQYSRVISPNTFPSCGVKSSTNFVVQSFASMARSDPLRRINNDASLHLNNDVVNVFAPFEIPPSEIGMETTIPPQLLGPNLLLFIIVIFVCVIAVSLWICLDILMRPSCIKTASSIDSSLRVLII